MQETDVFENEELDQQADQAKGQEKAIPVIQDYEQIIRFRKKGIFKVAFRQGKIFKRFKDLERFREIIKELGVSRSTVYFKLNF